MVQREAIRPPQQERSRHAWERAIAAGRWILENEGREALTVSAVCERAKVSPTAIYRRVDGMVGFFWAIYADGMSEVAQTYSEELDRAEEFEHGSDVRVLAVIRAAVLTFEKNLRFLRPVIAYSLLDSALNDRASRESMVFTERMARLLGRGDAFAAHDVARLLHQECVLRTMHGDQWLSAEPESQAAFISRLANLSFARLDYDPQQRDLSALIDTVHAALT